MLTLLALLQSTCRNGLSAWLRMALLCLLCLLGFWGNHTTLHR